MRFIGAAIAVLISVTAANADSFAVGDLIVENALARATSPTAMAGAGYLTITNNGDTTDRLIGIEADFPRVEIHTTEVVDDVASMVRIEGIDIGPGEMVTLAPGGFHVMFMGLNGDPLEEGETVPATLVFENAGRLEIVFDVALIEAITGGGHGGHGDHSGHGDHKSDGHDHN